MRNWILFFVAACGLCAAAGKSPFTFREAGPGSLELSENGKPVYVYNHGMMLKEGAPENRRRSCYVHPVYAPDGTVVTDDFPRDHYHHRGIFWAWPAVTAGSERYDLWTIRGLLQKFVRWTARETKPESARLGVENGWFAGERRIMRETVEIVALPSESNQRRLDFTLTFEALEQPVEIAGERGSNKGYGGFSLRFAPREQTVIRTDAGAEARDSDMQPRRWAEMEALFQGRRAGARIEIDPSNQGFPNGWCIRHYGFLGVNFPGLESYRLEPGKPLVLKYRVITFSR